jgi:hypothetical protein
MQAIASVILLDRNLKNLILMMESGFTNEAGVVLAEALSVNKTLRWIVLAIDCFPPRPNRDELGAPAYEVFSAMLRGNTSIKLELPLCESASAKERLCESHNQMVIGQRLNEVGRGRLLPSSNQTTRGEWVNALHELSTLAVNDPPAFRVSCLYSLLRLNPSVVCMSSG